MIQRIGIGLFGVVWGALVFQLAFHLSFPSEALGDRMAYEVEQATSGKQLLRVEKASLLLRRRPTSHRVAPSL